MRSLGFCPFRRLMLLPRFLRVARIGGGAIVADAALLMSTGGEVPPV